MQRHSANLLVPWDSDRSLAAHAALRILLHALHHMHGVWRSKVHVAPHQIVAYEAQVVLFAKAWRAFQWKPTVWVHWAVAHSAFLLRSQLEEIVNMSRSV